MRIRLLAAWNVISVGAKFRENLLPSEITRDSTDQNWNCVRSRMVRFAALVLMKLLAVEIDLPKSDELSTPTGVPGLTVLVTFWASAENVSE